MKKSDLLAGSNTVNYMEYWRLVNPSHVSSVHTMHAHRSCTSVNQLLTLTFIDVC